MDKLEYIPGDLVMTNGVPIGTAKDVVYRVTSSDPSKTLELDDGTVLNKICKDGHPSRRNQDNYLLCSTDIEKFKLAEDGKTVRL